MPPAFVLSPDPAPPAVPHHPAAMAGAVPAAARARGRIATVAVEAMRFHKPVFVGDLVSCYARIVREGTTSITVVIETWARRRFTSDDVKVTEGTFVYVAIDEQGRSRALPPGGGQVEVVFPLLHPCSVAFLRSLGHLPG